MYLSSQSPSLVRARYFSVGILSLVLIGLAYGGAYLKVWLDAHNTVAHAHTFAYDLVIFISGLPSFC